MKIVILTITFLTSCIGVSQEYNTIYNVSINDQSLKWGTINAYQIHMQSDVSKSISIEYRKAKDTIMINTNGIIMETRTDIYYSDSLKFKRIKNLNEKIIEYTEYNGQAHIKDTVDIVFKKGTEVKTILGLLCNQLFFTFRGRHYEAYYAPEIPIPDGPYKFIGAPGLILEAISFDQSVQINAISITKQQTSFDYSLIKKDWFNKSEYVFSYNQYVEVYLNQWYKFITKVESENEGLTSSFNSRRIEILPNKLDPEYHE